MVAYERIRMKKAIKCNYVLVDLTEVANTENSREWINGGTGLTQAFIDYALPYPGDSRPPLRTGSPALQRKSI